MQVLSLAKASEPGVEGATPASVERERRPPAYTDPDGIGAARGADRAVLTIGALNHKTVILKGASGLDTEGRPRGDRGRDQEVGAGRVAGVNPPGSRTEHRPRSRTMR